MSNGRIMVVGAGVVGICCAINLRQRGFDVSLVDRKGPAEETSYGNSGVICNSYLLPQAKPALLRKLPGMLLNHDPRFRVHYPHLPALVPWLTRFASYCNRRVMERRVTPLSHLLANAIEAHVELMAQCSASQYLNDNGWLRLYTDEGSFEHTALERRYYDRYEVSHHLLEWPQIQGLEPALIRRYERGIWLDRLPSARNPGAVCLKYAEYFLAQGGKIIRDEIQRLSKGPDRGWRIHSTSRDYQTDQVVIAAGAWSPRLLGIDGFGNPVAVERGYHMMFAPADGSELTRCIIDVDRGFVLTPMEDGIRATSATNLVAGEATPDYTQIETLIPQIRATIPLGEQLLAEPWMGRRPSTADSLPIIGPSEHHPGLWYAFGHGHLGFTLGPVTGRIIADAVSGAPDPRNDAFLPSRFSFRETLG